MSSNFEPQFESVHVAKQAMRKRLRAVRKAVSVAEKQQAAEAVAERVLAMPAVQEAIDRRLPVGLYWAVGSELDTRPLLDRLWAAGAAVCLPRVLDAAKGGGEENGAGQMVFAQVDGPGDLVADVQGILAPAAGLPEVWPKLVFVPGVGFSESGQRLGQGGGFYDRWLARPEAAGAVAVGLGYEQQVVDALPSEGHDRPLAGLVTPMGQRRW